ncbi:MAG: hybrid sensor histidine kinase/response regulator [Gallionella sp.]|nr:hybrid sensor histidine kinase/response regulator [Gallionella sp.]
MDIRDLSNCSVVICDDSITNVMILSKLIENEGIKDVHNFTDPRKVIPFLKERKWNIDLLILDIEMPHMTGFDIMNAISAEFPDQSPLSILVITGLEDMEVRTHALAAGANDFLSKPFDQVEVVLRVRNLLKVQRALNAQTQIAEYLEKKVKERTAQLEQAKLEVEQASRGKDEFLAAISHELKTPLNHILGFADLLKEGLAGELSAEQKEMAQDIFDAGSKQLAIVNSLIELARLQAGKARLHAMPEDPAKLLGEIAARHAAKAQASGLAFAVEVAQDLGEMPLDREVVTHLLDQLFANAFKFTPSGGKVSLVARRVPRVEVAAPVRIEAGEYLELAVADNGPGIAPEILPRLFQPFVQGDGRLARSHGGTGIGLTLVSLLAELHGGGSGVESKPGAGAKFLVWLPCGTASAARPGGEPALQPPNII